MALHSAEPTLVLVLAALVVSPMVMIYRGLFRAIRADERDIRDHGIAAQGQVIEIRCTQGGRNRIWIVTVEFRVPERTEPVHFQVMRPDTISGIPKPLRTLNQGQTVPIHYRQKWPSLAVIDELVR